MASTSQSSGMDSASSSSSSTAAGSSASSSSSSATSSPTPEEPPSSSKNSESQPRKTKTTYNTFLSPSGSTSFFTNSWFESRPVRREYAAAAAADSSEAGASSSSSSDRSRPRPTYEEYRSEEPPQARLIRLRGLFDVLMDKDQREALADGRAKEAWTKSARRARYGAGGPLARGSLAREMHLERDQSGKEKQLDADRPFDVAAAGGGPDQQQSLREPPTPSPPRQSYANELLAQCRQCRIDLEKDRAKRQAMNGSQPSGGLAGTGSSGSSSFWKGWPFSSSEDGTEKKKPLRAADSSAMSSLKSAWSSIAGPSEEEEAKSAAAAAAAVAEVEADYDGESGYAGSGVWGLSAVKHSSRDRERKRQAQQSAATSSDPAALPSASQADKAVEKQSEDGQDDADGTRQMMIEWEGFLKYAETKERELFKIFEEVDRNGDMRLDVSEIQLALDKAGIKLAPASLEDFVASLSSSTRTSDPHAPGTNTWYSHDQPTPSFVTWPEFRDYLLLLPRKPSVKEIFHFYQVRKAFGLFGIGGIFSEFNSQWGSGERHGATSVTSDGDVSMAGEEKKRSTVDERKRAAREALFKGEDGRAESSSSDSQTSSSASVARDGTDASGRGEDVKDSGATGSSSVDHEEEEEDNDMIHSDVAVKFLLAGGIAGAVSRTATAPFDRLKIYLITASTSKETATATAAEKFKAGGVEAAAKDAGKIASRGFGVLGTAVQSLYREGGGLKAFWLGNGLNCIKIFPESAIKFLSYEMSKRAFAKYVDEVSDSRDISGASRFVSGGIGGITSQLAIYPVETLKTRLMSSQGENAPLNSQTGQRLVGNELLFATARKMWLSGGLRVYYRGLTAGLIGVFPYSAIDMSTFEGIKLAYMSWSGKDEPATLALLAFGSISGSVGASTVYPLNLIRTRLQAAGTPAHPQVYDGFLDAVRKTYRREGFVGFYRGLVPTLAKVVPAVSISYVCYENSKKRLGVA